MYTCVYIYRVFAWITQVLSFGEGKPTPLPPWNPNSALKVYIVPPKSANPGFGEFVEVMNASHLNVCKPSSRDDPGYRLLVDFLKPHMGPMFHSASGEGQPAAM